MGVGGVVPTIHFCGLCRAPVVPEKLERLERRRDELADALRKSRLEALGIDPIAWAQLQPAEKASWRERADEVLAA